jgi:hypothetical protein
MKAHWYRRVVNFGDQLTPWLIRRLLRVPVTWAPPRSARIFGVGSIAQLIPPGYRGVVWGTGKIREHQRPHLDEAQVLALRGPLTGSANLYADPGVLAGLDVPAVPVHEVGVISHYIEPLPHRGHRIDVGAPVETVIAEAAKCQSIITSSLHGLILADSLGVPSKWVYSDRVVGAGFKFRDYAASFDEDISPGRWRQAPPALVAAKQTALKEVLIAWYG